MLPPMQRLTPPWLRVTGKPATSSNTHCPLSALIRTRSARAVQDYTLLRDGHEENSVFDLEAQRKSSASISRLLGLAKDETGVRVPQQHGAVVLTISSQSSQRFCGDHCGCP